MPKTTIDFSDAAAEELDHMASTLTTSKADVVRNALALYGFLLDELSHRSLNLAIVKNDVITKVVAIPGLSKGAVREPAAAVR